jgi:hypothetical protein
LQQEESDSPTLYFVPHHDILFNGIAKGGSILSIQDSYKHPLKYLNRIIWLFASFTSIQTLKEIMKKYGAINCLPKLKLNETDKTLKVEIKKLRKKIIICFAIESVHNLQMK